MTRKDALTIITALFYFLAGIAFGELKISLFVLGFFVFAFILKQLGVPLFLSLFIRAVHVVFWGLLVLSKLESETVYF